MKVLYACCDVGCRKVLEAYIPVQYIENRIINPSKYIRVNVRLLLNW